MLFNSWAFLIFLPVFAACYWATGGVARLWVMLIGSLIFYAWWDWRFVFLVLFSALVDYSIGILLENETDDHRRHRLIVMSVAVNLGLLGFFKYFNFFVTSAGELLSALGLRVQSNTLAIVLPVGISFYVFKTMSYTIDVYRRTEPAERSLLKFTTFVVFFPELVAGPIVRASRMLPQMKHDHKFSYERTLSATTLILSGYVRKVVIADSLAPLVDVRFANPAAHSALSLLLGVYLYAFQIYCDFSGYSNIAIGLARFFGFDFGINFDRPYFSRSFSEFWTRWHISLSSWLRDYLYIPLGGNRGSTFAVYRNLMLTMLLGGLWHGANWTFVAWGGLHGFYLMMQRLLGPRYERLRSLLRIPSILSDAFLVVLVFHLTCLSWVFFRAPTFGHAWQVLRQIGGMRDLSFAGVDQKMLVLKCVMLIAVLIAFEIMTFQPRRRKAVLATDEGEKVIVSAQVPEVSPILRLAFAASCIWTVLLFGTFSGNSFIYFQF
ncbi:MAG: alginate O-acetyltransferase complex protein AlgI [Thermoanaerobaculia bacterium]|jgi:D-alanyl-lipoteichoic acid acyltransferase DltB (MBOAT superfamily)|nr:alginate O-acetyltransferase complex protein AlgI [Thermoanaerobaculia bacterium]